ncbi:MAG: hypothetical protein EOP93_22120, partial [Lysobacteraceae bacterium]
MRVVAVAMLLAVAGCESAPPAPSLAPEKAVEQFMWNYTAAWNKHDAPTIARDFYRQGPSVAEQTMSLKHSFAQLKAQGYDHSDIHEIKGCITGVDTAWAGMKFTRLTAAGTPLPPKDRASAYELKK